MKNLAPAIRLFLVFTVLTGIAYPLLITAIAGIAFPWQAGGSLIVEGGAVRGSDLIGQEFSDPKYFWGRPSATSPPYNAAASSGSNLGPTNPRLRATISARANRLLGAGLPPSGLHAHAPIPTVLVTASASGLDPHIPPEAADYQVPRIAHARGLSDERVRALVREHTQAPQFGILGEPVVNVLRLNLALDREAHR